MKFIDLRSDTVTQPTQAMREAMAAAKVGDDVYGEDPTINQLQEMAAERMGQEAGLFIPSGTMGNLVAMLAHCQRGDEVILGNKAHTFLFEAGGVSAMGGIHSCQLPNQPDGTILLEDIRAAIREDDDHQPITRLITLENTHNRCGGAVVSGDYIQDVASLAHSNNLSLHIDGARIFNAAAALGVPVTELAAPADSITFCLSKGLCAPVGSVLCGSAAFIKKAHRARKILGGGMRQAGILAAAGVVALETMTERLIEDHARAKILADGLKKIDGIVLDPGTPISNMVFCSLSDDIPGDNNEIINRMSHIGVKIGKTGARRFRFVTHYWIEDQDIDCTISSLSEVMNNL